MEYKAEVIYADKQQAADILILKPSRNLFIGETKLKSIFGKLTSLETDLLTFSAAIFACDIAFKRGKNENFIRSIELNIPVVNLAKFSALHDKILFILGKLSDDAWHINFIQRQGFIENNIEDKPIKDNGCVLLLSGGLDSLSGAINIAKSYNDIQLVSHVTGNPVVRNAQRNAFEYLDKLHPSIFKWTPIFVTGKTTPDHKYMFPSDNQREDTQRTRSFLFLTLAGIFAHRRGNRDIIFIAENGQLAIHLPFTGARISSFSTHTAHPEVINGMSEVLSSLLSYEIKVINPFVYLTKAEVIRDLLQNHMSAAKLAVSCWKASRVVGERNHCGECIPCLIRRIAVESNGVHFDEYARDIFSEDIASLKPDDEGKHNITDLGDFINIFEKRVSKSEILDKHIDLINPFIDVDKAINMYRKFAKEARSVFNSYPILKEYMK